MPWKCPCPECPPTDIEPQKVTDFEDEVPKSVCGGDCGQAHPTEAFVRVR